MQSVADYPCPPRIARKQSNLAVGCNLSAGNLFYNIIYFFKNAFIHKITVYKITALLYYNIYLQIFKRYRIEKE